MKAAVTELRRRAPRRRTSAIGFCFGGGMVWRLPAARLDYQIVAFTQADHAPPRRRGTAC